MYYINIVDHQMKVKNEWTTAISINMIKSYKYMIEKMKLCLDEYSISFV